MNVFSSFFFLRQCGASNYEKTSMYKVTNILTYNVCLALLVFFPVYFILENRYRFRKYSLKHSVSFTVLI